MRGRIRTVKPELFKSEKLWDLQLETGLPLTQAFVGLFCYADRDGRFEWRPRALKSDVLPYWDGDMVAVLEALASKMFIVRYTVNGKDYGYVRDWHLHQVVNNKELPSGLPAPSDHASATRVPRDGDASISRNQSGFSPSKGKGREGNGYGKGMEGELAPPEASLDTTDATPLHREPKPSRKRPAVGIPDDLKPNDTARYLATQLGVDIDAEMPAFRDHHLKLDSRFSDWQAAIRTWVRNAHKFAPKSGPRHRRSEADDRLREQTDRVQMLRAQEAEEERRAAGGGS